MDLEAQIKALEERTDLLEIAVWSLEKSDERTWQLLCDLDAEFKKGKGRMSLREAHRLIEEAKHTTGGKEELGRA